MNPRAPDRPQFLRQALTVQRFLVGYNILEGLIAIGSGLAAGSIALIGFGLDSFIEVVAASMVVWRLAHQGSVAEETAKERRALLVVGVTFFLLAGYVLYEAGSTLVKRHPPDVSIIGIALAALSLFVMPVAGLRQRALAKSLGSAALAADAVETFVCTYLSFALLLGLGLNALWGWWWADPVAALVMLPLILKEGWEAISESRETEEQ
jgi:divalent metal cation (Fe/Co/Zn/Cd) transporter